MINKVSLLKKLLKLDFFNNRELRLKLNEIIRIEEDSFGLIGEIYDAEENKDIGIYHITEYVEDILKHVLLNIILKSQSIIQNNLNLIISI